MEINRETLSNDLKRLREYLSKSPSKDAIKTDYPSYLSLCNLYESLTNIKVDDGLFLQPDRIYEMIDKKTYKNCDKYCDFLDEYMYTWYTLFSNYCDILDDADLVSAPFFSCFRRYSEKDFKDIILSYFSMYGDKEYKIVKRYFDEGRVGTNIELGENDGLFMGSIFNKYGYVLTQSRRQDTYAQSVLVHEFGHAIDREMFLFPQNKKISTFNDTFLEVPSAFFEVGFYDFLLKNKIDIDGSQIQINDTLLKISDSYYPIYEVISAQANGSNINVDYYGDVLLENNKTIHLRDELIYGLGYYMALCMHSIADGNYKEYMKTFYNFIMTRGEMSPKESIECLGFDFDEFLKASLLKPKIEENNMILRKRFNLN